MKIANNLSSIHSYKKRYTPSYNYFDKIDIPNNSSEIILGTTKNLDMRKVVNKDLERKLEKHETNDFHFYDIPFFPLKEPSSKLHQNKNFKSIHNHIDLQHKNFITKIFTEPKYTDLEQNARNSLKKNGSLLFLNEMFYELEKKKKNEGILPNYNFKTDPDQTEFNVICNLDKWILKAKKNQENRLVKGHLPQIHPKLENSELELAKRELLEEEILKKYNNEDNENLKIKVRKKEDYEVQAFLKKMPKINKMSTVFFEKEEKKTEETNELFLKNLKKNVNALLRADVSKTSITEMAEFYEKNVDFLNEKIERKIKNLDALLVTKERTMQLIRKENVHVLDRLNKIKELKISLIKNIEESNEPQKKATNRVLKEGGKTVSKQIMEFSKLKEIDGTKKQIETLQENYNDFQKQLAYNNGMILDIEPCKKKIKEDLRTLRKIQRKFFLNLLKFGKDFRIEGLVWLIRHCWSLGEKVDEKFLPDFLDLSAKEFLLARAKHEENIKEYELFAKISVEILKANVIEDKNSIFNGIDEMKIQEDSSSIQNILDLENSFGSLFLTKPHNLINIKENQIENFEKSPSIKVNAKTVKMQFDDKIKEIVYKRFKNSIKPLSKNSLSDIVYEETRNKIKELIKPNYEEENPKEKTHFDELSTLTFDINYSENFTQNMIFYENDSKMHLHNNKNDFLKELEMLNKKIYETQKIIRTMQNSEVYRIIKEFDYRNYSKRFNVDVPLVLSCLVGVKQAQKEISKFAMKNKDP